MYGVADVPELFARLILVFALLFGGAAIFDLLRRLSCSRARKKDNQND